MAVDIQKLLPQRPVENRTIVLLSDTSIIKVGDRKKEKYAEVTEKIDTATKLLAGTLAEEKKRINDERRKKAKESRSGQEADLEKGKKKKSEKDLTVKKPKMSFLDRIKKFINNIIFGFLLIKLVDYAPVLVPIAKGLAATVKFVVDIAGKILNSLVTLVDWGYKAYDWTRGAIKNIGGEKAAENFDKLAGALNKFLNIALIVGMATMDGGGSNLPGGKPQTGIQGLKNQAGRVTRGGTTAGAARRYASRYGRDAAVRRFGADAVKSLGGKYGRSAITNFGRDALVKTLGGRGAAKTVKFAAGILKPIVKNVPLIGGIVEFILSWISGDPVGKAAFKGVGSGLGTWAGGALGTLIGGPVGTAVGMFVGSQGGSALGGLLYDAIFSKKEPKAEVEGRSEGGLSSRTIGGEKKNIGVTVKEDTQRKPDQVKIKGKEEISTDYSKIDYFGPMLAVSNKMLLGEQITPRDYESIGQGFTNLYLDGIEDGEIKGKSGIKEWVTSSMEKEVEKNKETLKKVESESETEDEEDEDTPSTPEGLIAEYLKTKLGIKPPKPKTKSTAGTGTVAGDRDSATGELMDANVSGTELDLFQRLVIAESGGEGPVGMALVARSVLNRAGLIQSGKASTGTFLANDSSITGVIMGRGQYQPISDGSINTPRTDAQMATALEAIKTAQNVDKLRGILKSEGYDDDKVTKMLAATGFRTGSAFNDPSQNVNVTQHKNHFFNTAGNEGLLIVGGSIADAQAPSADIQDDIKPGRDKKLYLHWTAGGYEGTAGGYHTVITGDGKVHRKIDYNKTGEHTESRNQNSVGLAVAAMREVPKGSGKYTDWPKPVQIDRLVEESAKITKAWGWKPSDINIKKVMTHGEAGSGKDGYLPAVSKKPYNYGPKVWGGDGSRWDLDMLSPSDKIGDGGQKLRSMIKAKYAMGGKTKPGPHLAMVGEEGTEFVIDHDSFKAIEQAAPGFLDLLNKAEGKKAADLLMNYTSYNDPTGGETIVMSKTKVRQIVAPYSGSTSTRYVPMGGGSSNNETLDYYG